MISSTCVAKCVLKLPNESIFMTNVQCKIFEGCKFRRFCCFPSQNVKINSAKMNEQLVMWLDYACNLWIYFSEIKILINQRNL